MRVFDRAFGVAFLAFLSGSAAGGFAVALPGFRGFVTSMFQFRVMAPVQSVYEFGGLAVLLLIFLNNSIAVVLSFFYPLVLAKIHWTPRMSKERMHFFSLAFTVLASFLIGFFNLGAIVGVVWISGGEAGIVSMLSNAWIHAPLEFGAVLVCVAEPLRIARVSTSQRKMIMNLTRDLGILWGGLLVLLFSAALEVFLLI